MNKKFISYILIITVILITIVSIILIQKIIRPTKPTTPNQTQDNSHKPNKTDQTQDSAGENILPGSNTSVESTQYIWSAQGNNLTAYNKSTQAQDYSITLPAEFGNGLVLDANSKHVLVQDYITRGFAIVNISNKKVVSLSNSIIQVAFLPNSNLIYQKTFSNYDEIITSNVDGSQPHIITKIDSGLIINFLPLSNTDILYYYSPLDLSNTDIGKINISSKTTKVSLAKLGYYAILSPDKKTLYYNFVVDDDNGESLKTGIINLSTNKKTILDQNILLQTVTWNNNEPVAPLSVNGKYQIVKISNGQVVTLSNNLYLNIIGLVFKTNSSLLVTTTDKTEVLDLK